ncbi:MAG: 3-phenylpropionate/trans-cinnamate dioxygenase ferredoxin subunit [Kiritimatiellia bacterium]
MFVEVCRKTEISDGDVLRFQPKGSEEAIVICNSEGEFYAISDRCSHGNWSLSEGILENCHLECILHGSAFNLKTGWPDKLPATKPVEIFDVRVEAGTVLVDISSGRISDQDGH